MSLGAGRGGDRRADQDTAALRARAHQVTVALAPLRHESFRHLVAGRVITTLGDTIAPIAHWPSRSTGQALVSDAQPHG